MSHSINSYQDRVSESILPLSKYDNDLSEALKEWYFTGETVDHVIPSETCHLCYQEYLRYHFEIKNRFTDCTLMVGSSCILKFGITVYDQYGNVLNKVNTEKILRQYIRDMRFETCVKALRKLAEEDNDNIFRNILNYFANKESLSPRQANLIFWKLKEHKIDYEASFFKINLRKDKFKHDITFMPKFQFDNIYEAFTSEQRRIVDDLRDIVKRFS